MVLGGGVVYNQVTAAFSSPSDGCLIRKKLGERRGMLLLLSRSRGSIMQRGCVKETITIEREHHKVMTSCAAHLKFL